MVVTRVAVMLAAVCVLTVGTRAARILAVFPDPARSHAIAYEPLTKALAARGHQVTVISAFPQKTPIPNYTDIAVPFSWFGLDEFVQDMSDLNTDFYDSRSALMSGLVPFKTCRHYLQDPHVRALIASKNAHFDLVILELLVYECFLGFSHRFDAPIIGVYAQASPHWVADLAGNPSPYAYIPNTSLFHSDRLGFWQRLENALTIEFRKFSDSGLVRLFNRYMVEKHFADGRKMPSLEQLKKRLALFIFNTDPSFGFPRPLLPKVIEVGGMHIQPKKPLPQDLAKFLDEAENGVIYFTMGSHIGVFRFPPKILSGLLDAFSQLKQRVLWKLDEEVKELPANVKIMKWIPQGDVLGHPKTRLFLSHGGLLGTQEAIYHGVPMVGIPLCKDQFLNVRRAQDLGLTVQLDFSNITAESVLWAVDTVLSNPRYRENARRVSLLFRDQLLPPLEKAVFWTEYVLRHRGAPHLHSAALDLAWYQYWLVDVAAVLGLLTAALLLVLFSATRAFSNLRLSTQAS